MLYNTRYFTYLVPLLADELGVAHVLSHRRDGDVLTMIAIVGPNQHSGRTRRKTRDIQPDQTSGGTMQ